MALDKQLVGFFGSMLLLYSPARDQIGRIIVLHRNWQANRSQSFDIAWKTSAKTHEAERNSFNFFDSFTMALGAALIGVSFLL